jgi:hypothetical protein
MPKNLQFETIGKKNDLMNFLTNESYPAGYDKKRNFRAKASNISLMNGMIFHNGKD